MIPVMFPCISWDSTHIFYFSIFCTRQHWCDWPASSQYRRQARRPLYPVSITNTSNKFDTLHLVKAIDIQNKLPLMFEMMTRGPFLRRLVNDNVSGVTSFEKDYSYHKLTLGRTRSPSECRKARENLWLSKVVITRKQVKMSSLEDLEWDTRSTPSGSNHKLRFQFSSIFASQRACHSPSVIYTIPLRKKRT